MCFVGSCDDGSDGNVNINGDGRGGDDDSNSGVHCFFALNKPPNKLVASSKKLLTSLTRLLESVD